MNIEQLKTELNEIQISLDKLKDGVNWEQLKELDTKIKEIEEKINNMIESSNSKEEKEELNSLLNRINTMKSKIKRDIKDLQTEILEWKESEWKKEPEWKEWEWKEWEIEDKWFFWKTWDWIKEKRNRIKENPLKWTKEQRNKAKEKVWNYTEDKIDKVKDDPWKYIFRGAGFILIYSAINKTWNWIFWKKKKEKEKKSFFDRWYWKPLKWLWIAAAGGVLYNWIWKYFGWRWNGWPTWKDSDEDKFNSYDELSQNPEYKEKFENYEWLWEKVDNVYQEIYGRELQSWYEDELEMKKIAEDQSKNTKFYKWIIPYCLDNQFKTVEGILWQNSSFKTAINNGLDWMINFAKNAWNDFLKLLLECYLKHTESWGMLRGLVWSWSDKIDQWKIKNPKAEKEMQYFFRQSIRVQTYLFQKKDQLTKKIVKEAATKYWKSEDEIWNDKDLFEKYVTKDPQYQNFLNSPVHSAVTILSQNNLFDDHIDEDLKKHVAEIDEDRNKILWCKNWEKDIIEIISEKKQKSENLDKNDDKNLEKACDGIMNSMDSIIEIAEDSAWNIYGDLFKTGDSNLREYLEKSWLDKMFQSYKQILLEKKQELIDWKLSNEDKIALAESINTMLALKKEAELWQFTIEKDYDENGNIIYRIPWFLSWSVKNLVKWVTKLIHQEWEEWLAYTFSSTLWWWILITAAGAVYRLKTGKTWLLKTWAFITTFPASLVWLIPYKIANHIKPVRDFGHEINPLKYRWVKWAKILLNDLEQWYVSLERAGKIIERRAFWFFSSRGVENEWKSTFKLPEDLKWTDMKKVAFDAVIGNDSPYLRQIKDAPDGLYDELVKKYDASKELRQALKSRQHIDNLKLLVNNPSNSVDNLNKIRKTFNACIDNAIEKLKELPGNSATTEHINKLKALKKDSSLLDEEMEGFVKFINEWFDAKLIPELKKLFSIQDTLWSSTEKAWEKLKKLLQNWEYDEFKRILNDSAYKRLFRSVDVDWIVKNFDSVIWKVAGAAFDSTKLLIKAAFKVLSKVL